MNFFIVEKTKELNSIVKKIFENVSKFTKAKNIALRIRDIGGDFPFYKSVGYSKKFLKAENSLLCPEEGPCQKDGPLQCLCGAILTQSPLLSSTKLTASGAFITNNFHSSYNELAPLLTFPRLSCFNEFFISLAHFPVFHNGMPLALLMITHVKNMDFDLQMETEIMEQLIPLKNYLVENARISLPPAKKTISLLVVDDDPVISDLLRRALSMMGFQTVSLNHAQKALKHLQNNKPDLAIIDLGMPDISGTDLIKMIRKNPSWNRMKIMIFSGRSDQLDEDFFEKYNIAYVLKKPIMNIMNLDKIIDGIINETL